MNELTTKYTAIKDWAEDDRPREKLLVKGCMALSDAELLAILISTGTANESALELGKKILSIGNNNLIDIGRLTLQELQQIKGIGKAKAITIKAAMELGRRRSLQEARTIYPKIASSKEAFAHLSPLVADLPIEEFHVAYLNRANQLIGTKRISEGGISGTVVDPKVVFKHALDLRASSIILCHNHPSGNQQPSAADKRITEKLCAAGKVLDVIVNDHLIIADHTYFSFADHGLI